MANWPELQTIVMQDVQIVKGQDAGTMWQLVCASLPSLTQLDLSQNYVTNAMVDQLALRQWPLLSIGVGVDIGIFQSLEKADWPKLQVLSFEEADTVDVGIDNKTCVTGIRSFWLAQQSIFPSAKHSDPQSYRNGWPQHVNTSGWQLACPDAS